MEGSIRALETALEERKLIIKDEVNLYNALRPYLFNQMMTPNFVHKQQKLKRKQYKSKKLNYVNIVQL